MRFIYTKTFAILFGSLVVVALLLFFQNRGWLDPVKTLFLQAPKPVVYVAKSVVNPVKNFFSTIFRLKEISRENDKLRQKLYDTQTQLVQFEQQARENEALRKELGFAQSTKLALIPCGVLAQNPVDLTDTLVLDCGRADGVQEGEAIISQGFLAGKIIYAGEDTSTVLLATNSKFSADARLSKNAADGVVRGSFGSGLVLDQLSQNVAVEKGWQVVTAGINDKIPKNILIGEVGDVLSSQNELFKKTTLISPVNFNNLEFVFVVKP